MIPAGLEEIANRMAGSVVALILAKIVLAIARSGVYESRVQ
jgi:hypothetical protein